MNSPSLAARNPVKLLKKGIERHIFDSKSYLASLKDKRQFMGMRGK